MCENIRTECGRPLRPISSGIVTCFSTSSGAWPGNSVITVTCTSVTSGNASTGSARNAWMPAPMNSTVSSAIKQRLLQRERDEAVEHGYAGFFMRPLSSIAPSTTTVSPAVRPLITRTFARRLADHDRALLERPGRRFHEHRRPAVALDQRAGRHHRHPHRRLDVVDAAEHFRPEAARRALSSSA